LHEEYFISDFECDYLKIDKYDDLEALNETAHKMENLEMQEKTAVKLMLENYIVNSIDEAIENLDNMICTGESKMEESGVLQNMPESLQGYFDYEALGRDMEIEGSYFRNYEGIFWENIG